VRLAHDDRFIANGNASIRFRFRLHSHVNATIGVQNGVSAALAVRPSSGERLGVLKLPIELFLSTRQTHTDFVSIPSAPALLLFISLRVLRALRMVVYLPSSSR